MRSKERTAGCSARRRTALPALLLGPLVLGACGQPSFLAGETGAGAANTIVALQPATATSAAGFLTARPGDRVTAFLGRSFPPSHWEGAYDAAQAAVDSCIEAAGGQPPPRPLVARSDAAELQGNDLQEFRRRYGYGVVDAYRVQASQDTPPVVAPAPPVDPDVVAMNARLAAQCSAAGYDELRTVLPPAELVQRYDALLMEMAEDPDYLATSGRWLDCMSEAGYSSKVVGPYFAKGIIEEEVFAAQGAVAAGGRMVDYDSLQETELLIFRADSECLSSSGAGIVMLNLEQKILSALQREFPGYRPVAADPAGLEWASE